MINDIADILNHGKIQPQSVELEEYVLGEMMVGENSLLIGMNLLRPEYFYKEQNKVIFNAIQHLYENKKPVDIMTVTQRLKESGDIELAGGAYYVTAITNKASHSIFHEDHCKIIIDMFIYREVIRVCHQGAKRAYETDDTAQGLLSDLMITLMDVNKHFQKSNFMTLTDIINQNNDLVSKLVNKETDMIGLQTGLENLDAITLGFQKSDLIILAGRPGMGKTALVISIIYHMGSQNIPIGYARLEMARQQGGFRLESMASGLSYNKIRGGFLDQAELLTYVQSSEKLKGAPIYIDDHPRVNIIELRSKATMMKRMYDIQILFVDYIQLMAGVRIKNMNREQEIASISRELKILAKELEIPVVAISQLSRAVEVRGGKKRPQLQDLRESGAIEQDADVVMFVYRPEYYGIHEDEKGMSLKGYAEILVEKHRNGKTGTAPCSFDAARMRFVNTTAPENAQLSSKLFPDDEELESTTQDKTPF